MSNRVTVSHKGVSTHVDIEPSKQSVAVSVEWDQSMEGGEAPVVTTSGSASAPAVSAAAVAEKPKNYTNAPFDQPDNPISLKPLEPLVPSNKESRNSGGTADVLPAERAKATFNVKTLAEYLHGGPEGLKRKQFILSPTEGMDASNKYNLPRDELFQEHVKHFMKTHEDYWETFIPKGDDTHWMGENAMIVGGMMNHYGLFVTTVRGQASEEQNSWWLHKAMTMKIVGCYAQTELGHGSNVRGLQTTATYDKSTQEFILETPTLQSMKWWPGALGKIATHAVVYAQLIIDGKEFGVHVFMLQIRDENHRPLPGIELGDNGIKLGDHGNDTGFMRLDKVRIPREFMLARWQQVSPDGQYIKSKSKGNDKVHYATMMFARGGMIRGAGSAVGKAAVIAVRYSLVRRQGFAENSTKNYRAVERQIIDHQVQRFRLFKQLSFAYAGKLVGRWMATSFSNLGNLEHLEFLPELAATSSGLKAVTTLLAAQGIEDLRKSCGGNGYLLQSGIAALAADYVWQTTAEGDFVILMLQTARFLLKQLSNARKGEQTSGPCGYMSVMRDPKYRLEDAAPPKATPALCQSPDYLVSIHRYRALLFVVAAAEELATHLKSGLSYDDAWNASAVQLCNATRAHCLYFMMETFASEVKLISDAAIRDCLTKLACVFGTTFIIDEQFAGVIDFQQLKVINSTTQQLLDALRPNACALVDAFEIPDRALISSIGRYDGNIYEALFEGAKKSVLNQRDPFLGYHEYLRPYLDVEALKQHNKVPSKL